MEEIHDRSLITDQHLQYYDCIVYLLSEAYSKYDITKGTLQYQ